MNAASALRKCRLAVHIVFWVAQPCTKGAGSFDHSLAVYRMLFRLSSMLPSGRESGGFIRLETADQ